MCVACAGVCVMWACLYASSRTPDVEPDNPGVRVMCFVCKLVFSFVMFPPPPGAREQHCICYPCCRAGATGTSAATILLSSAFGNLKCPQIISESG